MGTSLAYDGAGRLTQAVRSHAPLIDLANNQEPDSESMAEAKETSRFYYARAQNLIGKEELEYGVPEATELPTDTSGRNRPGAIGDEALSWDVNGNLVAKGEQLYYYDYRNRLTLVTDQEDEELARYSYDAFNRRVRVVAGGKTRDTVWDGWQAIEEYENGTLRERRVYGNGIDEAVCLERDLDGDGVLEQTYSPLYDSSGNLAVVTDDQGKPIERASYRALGAGTLRVDSTPPEVEQVRVVQGEVWVELSEEVLKSELDRAVSDGGLVLYNVTADEALPIAVSQPVTTGDQARRRLVITTTDLPATGEVVRLTFEPEALVDLFHNLPPAAFEHSFSWPAGDVVLVDTQAPAIAVVVARSGIVEIELTEEVDLAAAATAIELDGATTTWSLPEDRYTLIAETALDTGAHSLTIDTQPLDLAGTGLAESFSATIVVDSEVPQQIVYRRPDPRETPSSATGNRLGFHGLPKEAETGFLYVRNRYYDPQMGRFITPDPLGYVDGPSMYQFAGYNSFNYGDPLGLYAEGGHYYTTLYVALQTGYSPVEAFRLAVFSQAPDEIYHFDAIKNYIQAGGEAVANMVRRDQTAALDHLMVNVRAIHALTGGVAVREMDRALEAFLAAPSTAAAGVQLHRLGDTFAHRRIDREMFLYGPGHGHFWGGTEPDTLQHRPDLYLEYVRELAIALARRRGASLSPDRLRSLTRELVPMARANTEGSSCVGFLCRGMSELKQESVTFLRALIVDFARQNGLETEIGQILAIRPEDHAPGAVVEILEWLDSVPGGRAGVSLQSIARAFEYGHRTYEANTPQ
ncbi:MAG: RHS repeat-associated core domain-containing protein [bacterium]|nr:RHS repeat-associated core domain-containing protein [bacterium]